MQLVSGEPAFETFAAPASAPASPTTVTRLETLEASVATLTTELVAVREELARFRKQFE